MFELSDRNFRCNDGGNESFKLQQLPSRNVFSFRGFDFVFVLRFWILPGEPGELWVLEV